MLILSSRMIIVSVPLPGFSGLRPSDQIDVVELSKFVSSFSPVAGIQWVETASVLERLLQP